MTKSRTLRKAGAVILSLAMALSVNAITPAEAAAKKVTLSATKGTITVGKTKTVKIKGTKKANIKKVTFKYTTKGVAKATRSGVKITVKGVAAGKTVVKPTITLKAKVGNKKKYTLKYTATVKEATPEATATPEAAVSITLSDNDGLQADGTALLGDTLEVSYGSALGTPKSISWYVNDKIVSVTTTNSAAIGVAQRQFTTAAANGGAGSCYAIIENVDGKTFKSNTITISDKEQLVKVSGFGFTDDYSTATNVVYSGTDTNAVASVTISKDVSGTFYIYTEKTSKYSNVSFDTRAVTKGTANVTSKKDLEKQAITAGGAASIRFKNDDGSVTYMFKVATGASRGAAYKVAFDQSNVDTDDISGTGRTDITVSDAATVPYLKAPSKIVITSAVKSGAVKVEVQGEDGKALTWLGNANAITSNGFSSAAVYNNASSAASNGTSSIVGANLTGSKGVFQGTDTVGTGNYFYASATTTAGIFGATATTLTSEVKGANEPIVTSATWAVDSSAASSAKVTFTNLVGDATVYMYNSTDVAAFDADNTATYRAKADVKKGDPNVVLTNVFGNGDLNANGTHDNFTIVVVPTDTSTYSQWTGGAAALAETPTSVKASSKLAVNVTSDFDGSAGGVMAIGGLIALNQFEQPLVAGISAARNAAITNINDVAAHVEKVKGTWTAQAGGGQVLFALAEDTGATGFDKGDGFSIAILGSTLKVTWNDTAVNSTGVTTATSNTTKWAASLGTAGLTIGQIATFAGTGAGTIVPSPAATNTSGNATTSIVVTAANKVLDQSGQLYTVGDAGNATATLYSDAACATPVSGVTINITDTTGTLTAKASAVTGLTNGTVYYFKHLNTVYAWTYTA